MTDEQAQAFLSLGNRLKTLTAERVRVSHILIKLPPNASIMEKNHALQKVKDIRKMIDNGGDFAELAAGIPRTPKSAPRGGDLDFVLPRLDAAGLREGGFKTAVGEVSEPVETQFGFPSHPRPGEKGQREFGLCKIKDDLNQFLYNMNMQMELEKFVKSLRSQARIESTASRDKTAPSQKTN